MGVASCSFGRTRRPPLLCIVGPLFGVGFSDSELKDSAGGCGAFIARAFGEGGIERPRRGARGLLPRPPAIGGLSIGGGGFDKVVYGGVD